MEISKLFFECEKCGQPFDIEIKAVDFKCQAIEGAELECSYEFKSNHYCCANNIEIKIHVWESSSGVYSRHEIFQKGLVNFRTGDNFMAVIDELCRMGSAKKAS